eukprot:1190726-Prorocentrum_minimum.AAC.4
MPRPHLILLHFTGPPVPITARMHSTPRPHLFRHLSQYCGTSEQEKSANPPILGGKKSAC